METPQKTTFVCVSHVIMAQRVIRYVQTAVPFVKVTSVTAVLMDGEVHIVKRKDALGIRKTVLDMVNVSLQLEAVFVTSDGKVSK